MLQRIQTVFLIMIVFLMIVFLFFPVWINVLQDGLEIHRLNSLYFYSSIPGATPEETVIFWPYAISGIFAVLAVTIALIEAFSYGNRLRQIKLGALNSLLMAGALISAIWFTSQIQETFGEANPGEFGLGLFLPAIALLCNIFANRFIRKDEKLVRSMDRIR